MELHQKLQALRKQAGLTQEELARQLFVSRTAISKWESGRGFPNLDSLKAIASFFSVTIDELLSSDELLSLSTENQKQTTRHFRDSICAVSDLCMAMLLFLPLFAERTAQSIYAVSLLRLSAIQPWLRVVYLLMIFMSVLTGALTVGWKSCPLWLRYKTAFSLTLNILSAVLFMLSLHPYAAIFTFVLLLIKVLLLAKRP